MATELPIISICDTDFWIDLRNTQFIQVDIPFNCIHFRDIQINDTHCTLLYDKSTKNVFEGTPEQLRSSDSVVEVRLPNVSALDPPTLSEMIGEFKQAAENMRRAAEFISHLNLTPNQNKKRL